MTKRQEKKRKRMTRTELEKSEAARFGGTLGSTQRSVDSKSKAKNDCGKGFRPSREGIPAFAKAKKAKKSHTLAATRGEGHHEPKNGEKKQQGRKGQKMPRAGKRKAAQKKTVRLPGKSAAKKKAQKRKSVDDSTEEDEEEKEDWEEEEKDEEEENDAPVADSMDAQPGTPCSDDESGTDLDILSIDESDVGGLDQAMIQDRVVEYASLQEGAGTSAAAEEQPKRDDPMVPSPLSPFDLIPASEHPRAQYHKDGSFSHIGREGDQYSSDDEAELLRMETQMDADEEDDYVKEKSMRTRKR